MIFIVLNVQQESGILIWLIIFIIELKQNQAPYLYSW